MNLISKALHRAAKRAFRIEYILFVSAAVTLISTEYFRNLAYRAFDALDSTLSAAHYGNSGAVQAQLSAQLVPYLYFNKTLSVFISADGSVSDIIDLKSALNTTQRRMTVGFDHLLIFCALLFAISITIIASAHLTEKAERERQKSLEEEQAKFRRDLHDSVAQDLVAAKIYLEKSDCARTAHFLDCALKETRYLIDALDLAPAELIDALIQKTLAAFEQNWLIKTDCFIASDRLQKLTAAAQSEILKILQEALSNIARHSGATSVQVKIIDLAAALKIIIADNGTGLRESSEGSRHHYGLSNMSARAERIGGTLKTENDGGLTIAITIADSLHR